MEFVIEIIQNILLLTLLGVGYYLVEDTDPSKANVPPHVLHGLAFGLIAFLVTYAPVSLDDGSTADARAAPVILAGFVAGPFAGFVAAAMGGLARGLVGGSFAFSGVIVYALYAAIGSAFWLGLRGKNLSFLNIGLITALALTSCVAAASMFFLIQPNERAALWLQNDLPIILTANILGIFYGMIVLGAARGILNRLHHSTDVHNTLRMAKRAGRFGVWDFNVKTGELTWDSRSKALHGISEDSFSGTFEDWARNVHPDDLARTQDLFSEAIKTRDTFDAEYRVVHADGTQKNIKGDAVLLRDAAGRATRVVGTNFDLTDIRTAESNLYEAQLVAVQAQKFDTIGQLTGGVAHDFNNLLAVIMGNMELALEELKHPNVDRKEIGVLLAASVEASQRGADLTRSMLAYARKARLQPVELDVNTVVRETENWMRRTIPAKIEIETNLQAGLWHTLADKSSLQSALINLLVNARDAFDGSGKVTIETANMRIDNDFITDRHEDIPPGRYVMLGVSDNGSGIEPAILPSIFDPFFTTKNVGKGSGLGLSMVQGFVKQSGGTIRVYSEVGVGTSFTMFFPVLARESTGLAASDTPTGTMSQRDENTNRILLVEDREEVLLVLKKTLRGAGYSVTTARSGDEGYELFCEDSAFDLIVTDIVMPGELQGPVMANKIRQLDPDMKFIFLSGYASESTVHGNGLMPNDKRLMKPVSRSDLLSAVEKSLET